MGSDARHNEWTNRTTAQAMILPIQNGDRGFIGVNMRLDPAYLPPGYVSEAINMRFDHGVAETRLGIFFPPWANKITATPIAVTSISRSSSTATVTTTSPHGLATGNQVRVTGADQSDYNIVATITVTGASTFTYTVANAPATPATGTITAIPPGVPGPWGTIYGIGLFKDPDTLLDYLIIAADGAVYYVQPHNSATAITLPTGVTITANVTFTQAFNVLLMHRGFGLSTMKWEGVGHSWEFITQEDDASLEEDAGTQPIPNSERSLFFQNRVWIPLADDTIAVSDRGDYTRYLPVVEELRINQGSSDRIVALVKFNDSTVIVFKQRSIYALYNVYGALDAITLDLITDQFGLVAADSVAQCGNDLLFLSQHGVMSLKQTEEQKVQSVVLPLSDPIQPLIDRINWQYVNQAKAAYWNNRYYLAIPLGTAEISSPEILPSLSGSGTPSTFTVASGATYRWNKLNETSLTNGSSTYTNSTVFVAAGSTVSIAHGPFISYGDLNRVYQGVNSSIAVYDFLNGAWSGYDTLTDTGMSRFVKLPVLGRERLLLATHKGWIGLYEEDYTDQIAEPYVDVEVTSHPSAGNTLRVNLGTTITAAASPALNGATTWGISGDVTAAASSIWADLPDSYGFAPGPLQWSAPNTQVEQITSGVRFYSTNGVLPVVTAVGDWDTISPYTQNQIESTITTRAYTHPTALFMGPLYATIDVQTWNPSLSMDFITSGVNEESNVIEDLEKSRLEWYRPANEPPFVATNADGDAMQAYRKDYSVVLADSPASDEAASFSVHTITNGVRIDLHQESRERRNITVPQWRAGQIRLTNTQGRVRVHNVMVDSITSTTPTGAAA